MHQQNQILKSKSKPRTNKNSNYIKLLLLFFILLIETIPLKSGAESQVSIENLSQEPSCRVCSDWVDHLNAFYPTLQLSTEPTAPYEKVLSELEVLETSLSGDSPSEDSFLTTLKCCSPKCGNDCQQ